MPMNVEELREAFQVLEMCELSGGDGPFHRMPEAIAHIKSAASELLTLREAGALIITPDDPKLLVAWMEWSGQGMLELKYFLNALRDAMPDGET